ncbi:ABC transporter permease [Deinococcus yavapaiensis]|uniref:Putative spermidine/putrescine transport system permease protein n=1 Tax=Deinococcus yavapaiensis KR-236 TaxID=694435 RepID=A0A318S7T9_9DEIO|nr:sugar ABC transporter permease [Deinococcus yavapaiensis]PYE53106.1 putative spermidine/putrescine transport system permease protein [Deinococcus yavapaiensis KR-236]
MTRARHSFERWGALPALLVCGGLFGGGLALAFAQSLGYLPFAGRTRVGVDAYRALLGSSEFWASLRLTLVVALASTLLSGVFGVLLALLVRRRGGRFALGVTLPIPHVVFAVVVLLAFSQSGLLSRATHALGWTNGPADFPVLTNDPLGLGMIVHLVLKESAFVGVTVLGALARLDPAFEDAAATLGATSWQRVSRVTLPLVAPTVAGALVLVFAFACATYEVPYVLGATFPGTLSVLAVRAFGDVDLGARSTAMAISVLIAASLLPLVVVYARATRKRP